MPPVIPAPEKLSLLSSRERVVLRLLAEGLRDREIGDKIKRETSTVNTHVLRIMAKLGARRRVVLVRFAVRAGLVEV